MTSLAVRLSSCLLLLLALGCGRGDKSKNRDDNTLEAPASEQEAPASEQEAPASERSTSTEPEARVLDPRSQRDLAAAIKKAEVLPEDEADIALDRTRQDWLGKRYRWRVYFVATLCRDARRCNVLPFDRAGQDRTIVQGWLPRLDLSAQAVRSLHNACTGKPLCEFEFEGTLSHLVLSTEHLTAVGFTDVTVTPPGAKP